MEFSRHVKNNLSVFTVEVSTRVLREVWDYNEEKQEKQKTKCTVCLRNGSKEGKGQGNIHQSFQVGKGFALIEIFVKELSKTAITGVS